MVATLRDFDTIAITRARDMAIPASVPAVSMRGITKRFGPVAAVGDVSFSVPRGSFVSLLGPSGSGKSTILRMIAGFIPPSEGEILINDQVMTVVPPHKRSIGVVFQSLALFPHMTVAQNVAYPLKCRRFDRRRIPELVSEYLALVRLAGFENRHVDQLSGGQRQRVAIARALVYQPDILLLDEPLAALDKKLREEIQSELRRIQRELGVTTINVTHDQREALVMSDEIVVLDGGRLQQKGTPAAIYERPANRFVASFIGHTNVLAGTVTARNGRSVALDIGGSEVVAYAAAAMAVATGMAAECALRAERVRIGRRQDHLGESDTQVPGRVLSVAYEGDRVIYETAAGADTAVSLRIIQNDCSEAIKAGEAVFIGWNAADLVLMEPHGAA